MKNKYEVVKEIDAAIDGMNMDGIDSGLGKLPKLERGSLENPKAFAARIQLLNKERTEMKKPFRFIPVAAVAVVLMACTAFASGAFNGVILQNKKSIGIARSSDGITESEARNMYPPNVLENNAEAVGEAKRAEIAEFTFDSAEQAAKELDMVIPFPAALPEMELEYAKGQITTFSEDHKTSHAWITYKDNAERMLEISAKRTVIKPGSQITSYSVSEVDEGSYGKYISKSGVEFTTFEESNEEGTMTVQISFVTVGEYDYSVNFMGFDEAEKQAILDSVDLSGLR